MSSMVLYASCKANVRKRSSKTVDETECPAKKPVRGEVCSERAVDSNKKCVRFSSLKKLCRASDGTRKARIPFFFFDTEYCDDLRPNPDVGEFGVAVDDDIAIPHSMEKLRYLLPNMKTLNVTMESAYCWDYYAANRKVRYVYGINSMCEKLERFLRTNDRIETVRFDVLDTQGMALNKLKGFRPLEGREGDKFVKKVCVGKKMFHASVQAPSQDSTA
ncbi:hypothetical protein AAVH_29474 [Aphelenchoides avenae]|nr:hypothetical protein AAVH_29474 [Aphelenchus avenae]